MSDVTVVIPTIPPRSHLLQRAVASVHDQMVQPKMTVIEYDKNHEGAAVTRNRGLERVETEFVAFLDDDDELLPNHLELCLDEIERTGADLVYPWFITNDMTDPLPGAYGRPFSEKILRAGNYIPVTVVARTESVRRAGGFINMPNDFGACWEDWGCWLRMVDAGARFVHLPERTWVWNRHEDSTRGDPTRW
jgi:glycosyltransferase involved in cell wall biosynthesis